MSRQRPPKWLRVGPLLYRLRVGGRRWFEVAAGEVDVAHAQLLGKAQHDWLEVLIRPGLAAGIEREVVLHEVLHCCMYAAGEPLSSEDEEAAVRSVAIPLLGVLRDNPALVKFLLTEVGRSR